MIYRDCVFDVIDNLENESDSDKFNAIIQNILNMVLLDDKTLFQSMEDETSVCIVSEKWTFLVHLLKKPLAFDSQICILHLLNSTIPRKFQIEPKTIEVIVDLLFEHIKIRTRENSLTSSEQNLQNGSLFINSVRNILISMSQVDGNWPLIADCILRNCLSFSNQSDIDTSVPDVHDSKIEAIAMENETREFSFMNEVRDKLGRDPEQIVKSRILAPKKLIVSPTGIRYKIFTVSPQ